MTSPGRMVSTSPPRDWIRPTPSVTCRVWPSECECQAVRAHGANRTVLTRTREGASPRAMTSNQTSPVNISAGPLVLGCLGTISIVDLLRSGLDEHLERLAGVHRAVPVRHAVQVDGPVEHLARLDTA